MTKPSESDLLEILYRAFHSPTGIIVETTNAEALRQRLYKVRKQHEDLRTLILAPYPTDPTKYLAIKKAEPDDRE